MNNKNTEPSPADFTNGQLQTSITNLTDAIKTNTQDRLNERTNQPAQSVTPSQQRLMNPTLESENILQSSSITPTAQIETNSRNEMSSNDFPTM